MTINVPSLREACDDFLGLPPEMGVAISVDKLEALLGAVDALREYAGATDKPYPDGPMLAQKALVAFDFGDER